MFVSEVLVDQTKTFFFSVLGRSFKDDELTLASLNMVSHLWVGGWVGGDLVGG